MTAELLQKLKAHIEGRRGDQMAATCEPRPAPTPSHDLAVILGRLDEQQALIEALSSENEMLIRRVTALEVRMPPLLDGGRLPNDLSELECQIFYKPLESIPPAQRRVKTEWSLRLTSWIGGKRAKPDLNVKLYSGGRFYVQVMELSDHPTYAEQAAEYIRDSDALGGMLQAITKQKGRPYVSTQFCILSNHLIDDPRVLVVVDGNEIFFDGFRPGKGKKEGKAKWYAKVRL
jgi:hypothetical protein